MGSDALSKLTKAGETAWKSFQTKWCVLPQAVHRLRHVRLANPDVQARQEEGITAGCAARRSHSPEESLSPPNRSENHRQLRIRSTPTNMHTTSTWSRGLSNHNPNRIRQA